MRTLRSMAQSEVDAAAAHTPPLERLHDGVRRRRNRRRVIASACSTVALVGLGAVVVASGNDERPAQLASNGWVDDASIPGPELPVVGIEVTVASGQVGDVPWELVAYRTSPTADGLERVCSEFRTDEPGPQSCFPVDEERPPGSRWSFIEVVAGTSMYVTAVTPGTSVLLDGVPMQGFGREPGMPVSFGVGQLEDGTRHTVSDGDDSRNVSAIQGALHAPGDGTRQMLSIPALPGVHWERLRSDSPAEDGWIPVVGQELDGTGYLNPVDLLDHPAPPGTGQAPIEPAPVYGDDGKRIGWFTCSFSRERRSTCGSATTLSESPTSSGVDPMASGTGSATPASPTTSSER